MLQLCLTLPCRFDDIQDNSFLRRGVPAAHSVYGVANTISSAVFVHLISAQKALSSNHADMIKLYTKMHLDFWRGTEMEIYWRDNHTCPSEEEYLEMVKRSKDRVRALDLYACNKSGNVCCVSECRMYMNLFFDLRHSKCPQLKWMALCLYSGKRFVKLFPSPQLFSL